MKLLKLRFKKIKYSWFLSMGGYSYTTNEYECVMEGNTSFSHLANCEGS